MRLRRLHLKAFGPFTDQVLDFGTAQSSLVVVHGPNEAGKSSALRAISDLRFGIPPQSPDNFVHAHSDMRVGGEFLDRQGNAHSFMRRKGRHSTLLYLDLDLKPSDAARPVPPEVEALLTCGLTKDAYDSMFGLDHQRLRDGGEALLKGDGDVGAALFEASAGVRSIPEVLQRLDTSARKFFIPGARGKHARINECVAAYDLHHGQLRDALVRPALWADLFRKHQAATEQLQILEGRQVELRSQLSLIKELRAVAPLLSTLDGANQTLAELQSAPLLSLTASEDRAAAESSLADALHNAYIAKDELERETHKLEELVPDAAILALAPAIRRLSAGSESLDQYRKEIVDAKVDVASAAEQLATLATGVTSSLSPQEVVRKAPTPSDRVGIEKRLSSVELAEQRLAHHLEAASQSAEGHDEPALESLPAHEARAAFRVAQTEWLSQEASLRRLAALPAEIKATRRAAAQALQNLGLQDEDALRRVRPLLDAQIDAALREENGNATRRTGLVTRIDEITQALSGAQAQRNLLLARGTVATWDDVKAARTHRNRGWTLVRGTYIDEVHPTIEDYGGGTPLPQAYEQAVMRADALVDELAGDTERAAQLQASNEQIGALENDRAGLHRELEEVDRAETLRRSRWNEALEAAALPALAPAALRDWQALLPIAHEALETLQEKLDELEQLQGLEQSLAGQLRAAVLATGLGSPAPEAPLSTLSAMATEIAERIRQGEAAIQTAAGKAAERRRLSDGRAVRESQLRADLKSAQEDARSVLRELLLPEDAGVAIARARLAEFEEITHAAASLSAAQVRQQRAQQTLEVLVTSARAIWESLGDAEPSNVRLYSEHLSARLDAAESVKGRRALAERAADAARSSRETHESTAARHRKRLANLCQAAGVESPSLLPEAEERSRRKREAQQTVDGTRRQLSAASTRPEAELRALLSQQDAARMDAEEASGSRNLDQIEEALPKVRDEVDQARRQLDAIDSSDAAANARDAMERAASGVRTNMGPWIRSRIAHAILAEALKRFRDRAQGPMLTAASGYFERMTRGEFVRLLSDDSGKDPVLVAQRRAGARIRVEEMSEGTRDQLYLALRLAALDIRRTNGVDLPVVLDDVLMTSDEERSGAMLQALADFGRDNQVIVFTHHRHIAEVARQCISRERLALVPL